MTIPFTKMQGAGNDYVYVDCFATPIPSHPETLARRMADRHFGIGADGLILICPDEQADAQMRMYNADGSPAEMCGNGIRCLAKYVYEKGIARRTPLRVASAGRLLALDLEIRDERVERIRVDMGQPILAPPEIPAAFPGQRVVEQPLKLDDQQLLVTCVSMGNPHCVVFADELSDALVLGTGPRIENDARFPRRTNVEFVQALSRDQVRQRTWERGSGETLACGTGASAVCVAGVLTDRTARRVLVHLTGGDLELEWNDQDNHVYMTGPAEEVFTGVWPDDGS